MAIPRSRLATLLLAPLLSMHLIACSPEQGTPSDSSTLPAGSETQGSPTKSSQPTTSEPTTSQRTGPQFYVATNGDDANPGTIDEPWRTIQKAMDSATPGSTVNIRGGTYRERLTMGVSGTADNPIVFQPYGFVGTRACGGYTGNDCAGDKVVIDYSYLGVVTTAVPVVSIHGKQHIVIQGLAFQNYSVDGAMHVAILIDGGSNDIAFRWVRVENFRNVHSPGQDGTTMLAPVRVGWGSSSADNVTFSDCQFYGSKTNMSEVLSYDLGAANGLVERSHFRDADGISLHAYRGAHDFVFRDNLFEWCGVKRDGTFPDGVASATIYNDGGHDGVIDGNVVRNSAWAIQSLAESANALQGTPALPPAYNMAIRNNVVVNCKIGMVVGTWYSNTDGSAVHHHDIYNNTIYGSDTGVLVRPFDAATVRVRNNIVSACGTAYANPLGWSVGTAFDYNLYSGGGSGPDANRVTSDPMFSNAGAGDFTLLPGSPAINAGEPSTTTALAGDIDANGLPRIVGGRVDIGADERP